MGWIIFGIIYAMIGILFYMFTESMIKLRKKQDPEGFKELEEAGGNIEEFKLFTSVFWPYLVIMILLINNEE